MCRRASRCAIIAMEALMPLSPCVSARMAPLAESLLEVYLGANAGVRS